MTTIAYKDGIVAYDSRCCSGGTIIDNDFDKHRKVSGVHFFFTGATGEYDLLIQHYFGSGGEITEHTCAYAIVVDAGNLFSIGLSKKSGFWKCPQRLGEPYSIGSGEEHAITAMDMGATAKEAIKWAMKRDTSTGGRIRTFRIPKQP